jgi:small conductance mechanosensitive channel
MDKLIETLTNFAMLYGLKVIGAIVILILGRIAAGIGKSIVKKMCKKANVDSSITSFLGSLFYFLIIIFTVLAALAKFGIETASFVAILGAASFAVGFALQGSLANFASGVMILLFRPFKVGDYVEAGGTAGSVKGISLFSTILATPDNIKIIVPNGKVFGDTIKNITAYDTRRLDIVVGIGYESSIQKATEVFLGLIKADDRIMGDPEPQILVGELADSSVNIIGRFWLKKENYWPVKFDLTRQVKEAFDQNSIVIPFPQRTIHMVSEKTG